MLETRKTFTARLTHRFCRKECQTGLAPSLTCQAINCTPWDLWHWGDMNDPYSLSERTYCKRKTWATIAFVCATLWIAAAGFLLYFVTSGRHARWEEKHSGSNDDNDNEAVAVEVGTARTVAAPTADTAVVVATSEEPVKEDAND